MADSSSSLANLLPAEESMPQTEMDRVRSLILGGDASKQRFLKPEVDRLREMLFGEQIETYERLFADMRRDMERVQGDLRHAQDSIADLEKSQTRQLDQIQRDQRQVTAEMRRQSDQLQSYQAVYQQLLSQGHQQEVMIQKLQTQHLDQDRSLAQHEKNLRELKVLTEEYQGQQERKLNTVKTEIRQVEDKLYSDLRRLLDRMNSQKPDRKTLATMFMEIATRLETGGGMTNLLEDLATPQSK